LFSIGVMNHKYVSEKLLYDQVFHIYYGRYGLGWGINNPDSDEIEVSHGGSNGKPQAYLRIKPRKKLSVVVLSNSKSRNIFKMDELSQKLFSALENNIKPNR